MTEKVIMAMSGGVDSSVAAARLVEQGLEVIGVTLHLWDQEPGAKRGRCCAPEDVHDAKRVADQLGIAHYALDRRERFLAEIVDPFVDAYLSGRTPSPCATCNQWIKIPTLLRLGQLMDASRIATGHYAQVVRDSDGNLRMARGADHQKDQSYFLFALPPTALERLVLPLGDSFKTAVREEALRRGLVGAQKGESQDLCFVDGASYADFVERRAPGRIRPGEIVDRDGTRVGRHRGIHRFTRGQRKGLGVALGHPRFVVHLDPNHSHVVVDGEEALLSNEVRVRLPSVAQGVAFPRRATVRVRYRHEGHRATLFRQTDGALRIVFESGVRAPSPGQVAVAYEKDLVVAGGIISEVISEDVGQADGSMAT